MNEVFISLEESLRFRICMKLPLFLLVFFITQGFGQLGNTITRDEFNFGHQLGYMYAQFDSAYFNPSHSMSFSTGFFVYHTSQMPGVLSDKWKRRTVLMVPLSIEYTPCNLMSIQFDITDLFIEYPYINYENTGGKSPRVKTKILLTKERTVLPAIVLILGVKWSSAKPLELSCLRLY